MQILIPKTVRKLELQEYAPEEKSLTGQAILVWVDPPRSVMAEFDGINARMAREFEAVAKGFNTKDTKGHEGKKEHEGRKNGLREKAALWLRALRMVNEAKRPDKAQAKFRAAAEGLKAERYGWYARLWSQGPEGTGWTAAELAVMDEQNPAFFEWLTLRAWSLIEKHRADIKKN